MMIILNFRSQVAALVLSRHSDPPLLIDSFRTGQELQSSLPKPLRDGGVRAASGARKLNPTVLSPRSQEEPGSDPQAIGNHIRSGEANGIGRILRS